MLRFFDGNDDGNDGNDGGGVLFISKVFIVFLRRVYQFRKENLDPV